MNIQIKLAGQTLTAAAPVLAEQSLGKLFCSLEADAEWDNLSIRLIFQLKSDDSPTVSREVQVQDFSSIPVPEACIRSGYLYITAVGIQGDSVRLTTAHMPFGIPISPVPALSAATAEELTPTEYEQLLGMLGPLNQLETGRKDHIVGAINWLKDTGSGGGSAASAGYIDKSEAFDHQTAYSSPTEYLRTLGEGKWAIDMSRISAGCDDRYFTEIWYAGTAEFWLEQKYTELFESYIRLSRNADELLKLIQQRSDDALIAVIGENRAITDYTIPLPSEEDVGKILTVSGTYTYALTPVENAEEIAV